MSNNYSDIFGYCSSTARLKGRWGRISYKAHVWWAVCSCTSYSRNIKKKESIPYILNMIQRDALSAIRKRNFFPSYRDTFTLRTISPIRKIMHFSWSIFKESRGTSKPNAPSHPPTSKRTYTFSKNYIPKNWMTTSSTKAPSSERIQLSATNPSGSPPSAEDLSLHPETYRHCHIRSWIMTSWNRRTRVSFPTEIRRTKISAFWTDSKITQLPKQTSSAPRRWAKQWRCTTGSTKRKINIHSPTITKGPSKRCWPSAAGLKPRIRKLVSAVSS